MNAHSLFTKVLSVWGSRFFRGLFALIFALSLVGIQPARPAQAAGSTRVMCENDASLVGCWRMEEGTGTLLQDGGAFPYNEGTLTNSPPWVAGKMGNWALGLTVLISIRFYTKRCKSKCHKPYCSSLDYNQVQQQLSILLRNYRERRDLNLVFRYRQSVLPDKRSFFVLTVVLDLSN